MSTAGSPQETDAQTATLVSEARIGEMAASLADTTTSPDFLAMLGELRGASRPAKVAVAQNAIEDLKRDRPLPEGFRLTTRTFEMPPNAVVYFDESDGVGSVVYDGKVVTVVDESSGTRPPGERLGAAEIRSVIREGVEEIGRFVRTAHFTAVLDEMYSRPRDERPGFVTDVILDADERERRGISVPENLMIQRSAFADERPTLFCVTKVLPLAYPWQKVTITFDSD